VRTSSQMKKPLLLLNILIAGRAFAQCSLYSAAIVGTSNGHCLGAPLKVVSMHAMTKITWYQGSTVVSTATATDNGLSPTFRVVAGGHGEGPALDQLNHPYDLDVDCLGNVYVADGNNSRIVKWAPGATSGAVVAGGNGQGILPSQLNTPQGVIVDHSGNIYVSDYGNYRVQKWAPGAAAGVTVAGGNGQGSAANQVDAFGIYVDSIDNLYIADGANCRIQKWAPGATAGVTVVSVPVNSSNYINAVWLDGTGNLYFTQETLNLIQKWAPNATSGTVLSTIGPAGIGPSMPTGIYVDPAENVYVSNLFNPDILEWPAGGNSWTVAATGTPPGWIAGQQDVQVYMGLRIDTRGNLYAANLTTSVDEWDRIIDIDSTFTPTTAGVYTAVVTDLYGVTAQTPPFTVINPPPAPPSIQITASATATPVCTPIDFTAAPSYPGINPSYQWQVTGVDAGSNNLTYSNNLFADSDKVVCIMSSTDVCTDSIVQDTSNTIMLSIDPQGHASIRISADSVICNGGPAVFSSVVTDGATNPVYEWYLNGVATGDVTSTYTESIPVDGQIVYCQVTSDASCGLAKSNSIPITVYPRPSVTAGQASQIAPGQGVQLDPTTTGDIVSYNWTPAKGLSDSAIPNPVAAPAQTTVYTLTVTSKGGCEASGEVTVDVYTPLSVPNAFTPNGDGHNDVFYVLAGPQGARISELNVYDRWGACVFQNKGGAPGDPHDGWDGTYKGTPAPAGTYVYIAVITGLNGHQQIYKGTVILIR
jgi:gliding motility-associated-like protein